jgi:hypothetical protein
MPEKQGLPTSFVFRASLCVREKKRKRKEGSKRSSLKKDFIFLSFFT